MRHVIGRGRMNRSRWMRIECHLVQTGALTLAAGTSRISVCRAGFLEIRESGGQE
jgi:hypothetical protein